MARFIFSHQAPWISSLIAVRDAIDGRFGLKTAKQLTSLGAESKTGRVGIFKIYGTSPTEIVLGEDDKHLDFRLSVLKVPDGDRTSVFVSTICTVHNLSGKVYLFFVVPFHRYGVRKLMASALAAGRL